MILCQGVDEMSQEQLALLAQEQLVGRRVSIPWRDLWGPESTMWWCPYPFEGVVTTLRDEVVYGLHVIVESPGCTTCCFQVVWALENLTVIG